MMRLMLLLFPMVASAASLVVSGPDPSVAFARYIASLEQSNDWRDVGPVAVEIEASLPRLGKQGRLQAIRHSVPTEQIKYEVLHSDGDATVKQQVIARYLSAEQQAEALPAASVAVTPVNYKFRYAGSIASAERLVYVFEITPKRKREGLIQGQLWIDSATGIAVHQGGHLVKSPSAFLRRVDITRDVTVRDGLPYSRITHVAISTRLIGPAELSIKERQLTSSSDGEVAPILLLTAGGKP
jgi:hypothetical protein